MAQRKSYFEEKRMQQMGPGYFNKPEAADDVFNNIVRIIRDIHYNNISPQDFIYFKVPNVIQACVTASIKNKNEALTMYHALDIYRSKFLSSGATPYPDMNPNEEIVYCNNLACNYYNKYVLWSNFAALFIDIQRGANPEIAFMYIKTYDRKLINSL